MAASFEESQSDLAILWNEALDSYSEKAKVDIRSVLRSQMSINSIMMDQQQQLQNFGSFRHNKGKVDKLRSVIAKNADIIQSVAKHVSNAASSAFPPSSAILTAFTYVMNASKHVSDDYDMIEGFFDIMQSFLQRLSLLESKLPAQKAYQGFLMRVFSSLLTLSGLARSYCLKGRFMKWAKALVEGKDPELQGALDGLHENLRRLESATIIQTLRTTIEAHEEAKSANQGVKALQVSTRQLQTSLDHNTAVTEQNLETTEQVLSVAIDTNTGVLELVAHTRESANVNQDILRTLQNIEKRDSNRAKKNLQSGASKPANLGRLRTDLGNQAEGGMRARLGDFEVAHDDKMFDWLGSDPTLTDLADGAEPGASLWVSGAAGMGKSSVAYKIQQVLRERLDDDGPTTSVVSFFFDEDTANMTSVVLMLKWAAMYVAERDVRYCEELVTLSRRDSLSIRTPQDAWEKLVVDRFGPLSSRRLVLVLDGVDQLQEEELTALVSFVEKASQDKLRVQVVFTSDPKIEAVVKPIAAKRIDLTKEKIAADLRKLAWFRCRELPRLFKLKGSFRKVMARKVASKADTLLYVEHTLRRFNSLKREGLILKELDNMPENTTALYETLIQECKKNRTPNEIEVLRNLFAWLAYAKDELTLGDATKLINIIASENAISIEEELDGRSSRLLRISGSLDDSDREGESESDSELMDDKAAGDTTADESQDTDNLLGFQERSLRAYFRAAIDNDSDIEGVGGLRCAPSEAQAIIFKMVSAIMTMPEDDRPWTLERYASEHWMTHLLAIDVDQSDDHQAAEVLSSLHGVLTNKNDAMRPVELELLSTHDDATVFSVEGGDQTKALAALSTWAKRALRLPSSALPYGLADFYRPLAAEPARVFITLARAHIHNWFTAPYTVYALKSFRAAHNALRAGRHLPELRQSPTLRQYFADLEEAEKKQQQNRKENGEEEEEEEVDPNQKITERSFDVVANAFWDIVKTTQSYRGIGMAMKEARLFRAADAQFDEGIRLLEPGMDHGARFASLSSKGHGLYVLGNPTREEHDRSENAFFEDESSGTPQTSPAEKQEYLRQAVAALSEAISILDGALSQDGSRQTETIQTAARQLFQIHARASALLGDFGTCLSSIRRAVDDLPLAQWALDIKTIPMISRCLMDAEQPALVMELLRSVTDRDRQHFVLLNDEDADFNAVFRAARAMMVTKTVAAATTAVVTTTDGSSAGAAAGAGPGEAGTGAAEGTGAGADAGKYIIDLFRTTARDAVKNGWPVLFKARVLTTAAPFARNVLGDVDTAREIQREIVADPQTPNWLLTGALNSLSEILLEDFLRSRDPRVKGLALDEARRLREKMSEVMGSDFDPAESDTAVTVSVMLRKLGPAAEWEATLDAAFRCCVEDLKDDTYANDAYSMKRLARVLSCVDGMERDARIAFTAHNYILDDELHRKETAAEAAEAEARSENGGEGTVDAENGIVDAKEQKMKSAAGIEVPSPDVNGVNGEAIKRPLTPVPDVAAFAPPSPFATTTTTTVATAVSPADEMSEGILDADGFISCNYCLKTMGNWARTGPAYTCLYCVDVDICEDCMQKKLAREMGEMEPDWRTICPRGHKHVKAPIEGWRGVKAGVLRIGPAEEVPFQSWLRGVEDRWRGFWRGYWSEKLDG